MADVLADDGARVGTQLTALLVGRPLIKTQQYESYDPVEKLLIRGLLQTVQPMCIAAASTAGQPQAFSTSSST